MNDPLFEQARRVPPQWWLLLAMAPLLSVLVLFSLRYDFADADVADAVYAVKPLAPELTSATVTATNWRAEGGAAVPAGDEAPAELEIITDPGPWRRLAVRIVGGSADKWRIRVSRDYHAMTFPTTAAGEEMVLEGEDFPGIPVYESPVRVTITGGGAGWKSPLQQVALRLSPLGEQDDPPALPGAIVAGLLPIALALFLMRGGRRPPKQAMMLGTIGGAAAIGAAIYDIRVLPFLWAATAAFLLGTATMMAHGWWKANREGKKTSPAAYRALMEAAAIAAILCFALWMRWDQFLDLRNMPLLPDAAGYMEIAREGSFYQTAQGHAPWVREPLFPAVLRAWLAIAPDTVTSARFFMILLGCLPVLLTWFVGRRLLTPLVGIIAATFAALNPWMAETAVEVLRDSLLTTLLLGLMAVPLYGGQWRWGRAVLFALLGTALALTRVNALFLLVPFVGIEAWRRRWHPMEVAIPLILAVLVMLPHFAYNARIGEGNFMYSSDVHTSYYLNRAMLGQPGYPADLAAYNADPYAGGVVGMGELVSALGSANMIVRTLRGLIMIFVWEFPHEMLFRGWEWPMLFGLIGAWGLWKRRRDVWWSVLWFLLFMLPIAVIATIHLDRRLAMPAVPIILWTWALGVEEAGRWLVAQIAARRKGPSLPAQ